MLLVASPLLLLILFLCVYSSLVSLVCVLACFSLSLSCMGLLVPLGLDYFFFHVGEMFNYNLFKIFLMPFLFLFFFWDPYSSNVSVFDIVLEIFESILGSFHSSYLILLFRSYSTILSSSTLIRSCFRCFAIDSF